VWLSRSCFESEDIFFEEVLLDELFQVLSEGPAMNGLVSLAFVDLFLDIFGM